MPEFLTNFLLHVLLCENPKTPQAKKHHWANDSFHALPLNGGSA
jgi:hypothetical protein